MLLFIGKMHLQYRSLKLRTLSSFDHTRHATYFDNGNIRIT